MTGSRVRPSLLHEVVNSRPNELPFAQQEEIIQSTAAGIQHLLCLTSSISRTNQPSKQTVQQLDLSFLRMTGNSSKIKTSRGYWGATSIQATVAEIQQKFPQTNFHSDVKDTFVLASIPTTDPKSFTITLKWALVENLPKKTSSNKPVSHTNINRRETIKHLRDFFFIEARKLITLSNSRKAFVVYWNSIKSDTICPSLEKDYGVVRGALYCTGYVFFPSLVNDPAHHSDVYHILHANWQKNLPSTQTIHRMVQRRFDSLFRMKEYFQLKWLAQQEFLLDSLLKPKHFVTVCDSCQQLFGICSRKISCRICGQVVCTKCTENI